MSWKFTNKKIQNTVVNFHFQKLVKIDPPNLLCGETSSCPEPLSSENILQMKWSMSQNNNTSLGPVFLYHFWV